MSNITIKIADQASTKVITANIPTNVPMSRLVPALVKKMNLPEGKYKFFHKESGKELYGDDTLERTNAQSSDHFVLLPNIVADRDIPVQNIKP